MLKLLTVLFFFSSSAVWAAIGFRTGSQFQSTAIQGNVTVSCQNASGVSGPPSASYSCRDTVLDPGVYDYFVGPVMANAVNVQLHAIHDNGTTYDRTVAYDGAHGITKTAVNLWIRTLFQYPLLASGKNQIQFTLLDSNGRSVAVGEFEADVSKGQPRTCQDTFYNSFDSADCNSQYSVCQRYFEQFNNCR